MHGNCVRGVALALALASSILLGGCDDSEGGVGASVSLPAAFSSGLNEPVDIGVGSVHMVGNPRW
jgi:hypothetical protein